MLRIEHRHCKQRGYGEAPIPIRRATRLSMATGSMDSANRIEEAVMLGWAIAFFIIALIAGVLGFTGIASAAAGIAKILFFIFLVLFVLALVFSIFVGKKIT